MGWKGVPPMGMICEPYRVGKFSVGDHLTYRLWFHDALIAECATFEECQRRADEHAKGGK